MKRLVFFLTFLFSFLQTVLHSQTAMGGCGGVNSTLTQCGGTYADPGGTGSYPNNSNCIQTICPGTAGQCVTIQFTSFSLENNWDYLYVYNGNSTAAPLMGTYTGTTIPNGGNLTATNATGCLTLRFTSDGVVNAPGWLANVICAPCGSPPPPPPGPTVASDCSGAVNICTNSSFQIDPNGSGSIVEFTTGASSSVSNPLTNPASANDGCMISGELNSTWMIVNVATTGTLEFSFGADGGTNCLDWIMWPYTGSASCNGIINNTLAPVRCNYNFPCESFTGVGTPLPAGGEAGNFEPELNVTCGQRYLICLSNYSSATTAVPLSFTGTASVSCTTFTPITVNNATICPGASATLTANGGNTYTWSPAGGLSATTGATVTASPATTTTYTVTGTGACGTGTATSTVTVLAANDPACVTTCAATATNTGPYCAGGTIQLNGTGGGTYSWTGPNGFTSALQNPTLAATAAAAGTYTLTITISGCTATATTTVVVNPVATANANVDQTVCAGGTINLNGSFGGGATSGTWSAPSGSFSNATSMTSTYSPSITTGTVTLTLTTNDPTGPCPAVTDQMIVTVNPLPTVNAGLDQTVCAGASVTLAATGASTYTWSGGVTNSVAFTPSATATYTVTGTTAGCTGTDQVVVTVNPIPTVSAGPDVPICAGQSTTLTATGATTYSWSPGGQTTASITVSPASTTTYTVTGTSLGCTASDAVVVTVNANAPISAGLDVPICTGQSTTITATGGTTYNWTGLGAGASFTVSPTSTTTYTVVGTNAAGCTGTDQVVVTVNPLPTVNAGVDQTVCAGTSVTLTASGAATYTWNNGVTQGVAFTPAATQTYTVTGTTAAGCTGTDQVIVTVNPQPTVNAGADQTICAGASVTLTGTGAATYSWNNGVSQGTAFAPAVTTTYTVTGTSASGCTGTDQVIVSVNPLPTVNAGVDQTICAGTSVTLTATGATNYTWNNGITNGVAFTPTVGSVTYTVTGTTAGCINTDQVIVTVNPNPTPVINGPIEYCVGSSALLSTSTPYTTYSWSTGATTATINATQANNPITVTVTNANGCQGTSPAFTVTENNVVISNSTVTICQGQSAVIHGITQTVAGVYSNTGVSVEGCDSISNVTLVVNPLPAVNAGADQALCVGQSTSLTATGAATYSWNNGITQGINFTPAATNTYTVTGTSAQGCVNTDQVVVTVNPLPVVDAGPDAEACIGEPVTLTATGAVNYSWNNGVTNGVPFIPAGTTTYTVTGTDANGCIDTDQIAVTINPLPNINAGQDLTVCVGTQVTLAATGGISYTWDNGVTNGIPFTPAVGTVTYSVSGTDLKGCVNTDQVTVTVNPLPNVNAGPDQTVCLGTQVTLSGSGAVTYSWNNGITNGTPFTPAAGTVTYTVTGTDANGCINSDQVNVTVNPLPNINAGIDQSVCEGTQVTLTATGAVNYSWTGGVTNGLAFTPPVGTNTYTVTGTDGNGCVNTDQVNVTVNPLPNVFAGNDVAICDGETVTLTGSGASTYTWDNGVNNGIAFAPAVGTLTYTVTGTTLAGCTGTDQVDVTVNPNPVVSFTPGVTLGCAPLMTTLTNTTPDATNCLWTISNGTVMTGCGTIPVEFTQSGCYDVTLTTTSANGCSSSLTADNLICVEEPPIAAFAPSANQVSTLDTEVLFDNESLGATQYVWTFGVDDEVSNEENPTYTYPADEEGQYTVTLIAYSPFGCSDTATSVINVFEELIFYVPNTFTPDDDQYNPIFKPVFTSGFDPQDYVLYIYNRWGELIFESRNAEVGWDGSYGTWDPSTNQIEMCQDGTYTWKIEFKVTRWDERKVAVGHVNLIR